MILHVDMDAFYASIEERDRPELAGRPLIVGGTPEGRGVVAAANYAVRKFGVHSAMATATALRLCPHAIVLPVRMSHYAAISHHIRQILLRYTPLVEPLSLDEAFLDVSGTEALFGPPATIARRIKQEIRAETGLVASVGVAPNKFLAKVASDLEKPDGLVIVDPQRVQAFLDPLPVGRLWGVGKVTGDAFEKLGIRTIEQLRRLDARFLRDHFRGQGEHLWQLAHGLDDRHVVPDRDAKTISHETTFPADIGDREVLRAWLLQLTEQVAARLRALGQHGRTVQLKVRFSDFRTVGRSRTLPQATDVTQEVWQAAVELLERTVPEAGPGPGAGANLPVRLLGIGVSGLSGIEVIEPSLFSDPQDHKQRQLDKVVDAVCERYGGAVLKRAGGMLGQSPRRPSPQ